MKAITLKSRLEKKYKGSKNAKGYKMILDIINNTNTTWAIKDNIIRPCYTTGSGRFTSNADHTQEVIDLCNLLGLKIEYGNTSPRGGKTGQYIKILTKIEY